MRFLLVDDHPMTISGYRSAIEASGSFGDPVFTVAHTCEQAYNLIVPASTAKKYTFDVAVIDYSLPPYPNGNMSSGADLTILIRKFMPDCRIVMITAHTEVLTLYNILRKVGSDALLTKQEVSPGNLATVIDKVLSGVTYHSPLVKECLDKIWMREVMVEDYNRQILYYLSKGYKVKNLHEVVPLASSTIQRRVISMKKVFEVKDDSSLIRRAFEEGFL